jgi:hypothetical protein
LPFQRIKSADAGADMGNPKGPHVRAGRGRVFWPVYGKELTTDP